MLFPLKSNYYLRDDKIMFNKFEFCKIDLIKINLKLKYGDSIFEF